MGSDKKDWHLGVLGYSGVECLGLWEGVNLQVYEGGELLEYDIVVTPKGNLESVVLSCSGVDSLEVRDDGALVGRAGEHELVQEEPVAWYVTREGEKEPVTCRYRLFDDRRFGFEVDEPANGRKLVVDPVFMRFNSMQWSTFLGGTGDDVAFDVAVAPNGDVTVVGQTTSSDFPLQSPIFGYVNGTDVFVTRLKPTGNPLIFSTYLSSGATGTVCNEVALGVDTIGVKDSITVLTGWFDNKPNRTCVFPTVSINVWDTCACKLGRDAFVSALNGAGALMYTTYLGGVSEDEGWDIKAVPSSQWQTNAAEVVVAGWTDGGGSATGYPLSCAPCSSITSGGWITQAFQPTPGARQVVYAGPAGPGGSDGFIAHLRLDANLATNLRYSTFHGGSQGDQAFGLALDPDPELTVPRVFVVGSTASTNFPTTPGAFAVFNSGTNDGFVSHLNLAGGGSADLLASTYLGGSLADGANDVVYQTSGIQSYVTTVGSTFSSDFPTTLGAFDTTYNGGSDAFVIRLNSGLTSLTWSTFLGGSSDDSGWAICEAPGTLLVNVTGETASSNFPVTSGGPLSPSPWDGTFNGLRDVFVVRFKQTGAFSCGTFLGGTADEVGRGIDSDGFSQVVVTGWTSSSGYPTAGMPFQASYQGGFTDAFVTKLRIATLGN
ncbi:MAG: hypothetical protein RL885_08725 [Planctomycetota bacterium]